MEKGVHPLKTQYFDTAKRKFQYSLFHFSSVFYISHIIKTSEKMMYETIVKRHKLVNSELCLHQFSIKNFECNIMMLANIDP